jgi:drug/metabolite transporter (DMT)-like permease
MVRILKYLNEHSRMLKRIFFAFLILSVVFDFYAARHEMHFFGDAIIGFWALFGILGCLGMIIVCKGLSHVWLMKKEDYYDK